MFADIVNFTTLAEELTPKEVVSFLNDVFTRFDELAEKHGVDKIKTIGDAYMVAGGLSGDDTQTTSTRSPTWRWRCWTSPATTRMMRRYNVAFHVGIATGPAIAGVIGTKRFIYDLWGDTVNIASRITAEAPGRQDPGGQDHLPALGSRYEFGEPRNVMFKGKGKLTVYQLLGKKRRRGRASADQGSSTASPQREHRACDPAATPSGSTRA